MMIELILDRFCVDECVEVARNCSCAKFYHSRPKSQCRNSVVVNVDNVVCDHM